MKKILFTFYFSTNQFFESLIEGLLNIYFIHLITISSSVLSTQNYMKIFYVLNNIGSKNNTSKNRTALKIFFRILFFLKYFPSFIRNVSRI